MPTSDAPTQASKLVSGLSNEYISSVECPLICNSVQCTQNSGLVKEISLTIIATGLDVITDILGKKYPNKRYRNGD